ncbi:MAG TPA: non-canonical purine NTP pyrophosphatase [Anaerolineales bacterium]|nr:non-canonical purine NTP pyrophosphatase [Anaerolineales bacterium]
MTSLLIATNNPGKLLEFQELLRDTNVTLVNPAQIGLDLEVVEDGHTYAENAAKKAVAFAQASGLISLADDSGLEVDALDGAPGLYSARYGSTDGSKLSDAERRKYLLSQLQDKPRPWTAHFHATIAIALPTNPVILSPSASLRLNSAKDLGHQKTETLQSPLMGSFRVTNEEVYLFDGFCPGEIIPEERGTGGFGYDPIFLLTELGKTMAELTMDEKNRLSHRARAVMKAKEILKTLFTN